jgi:hypothetical protein
MTRLWSFGWKPTSANPENHKGLSFYPVCVPLTVRLISSVDVVLLPVEGGVGLDNDVFVGRLFQLVDQHGLAGL